MEPTLTHNHDKTRFEMAFDGGTVFANTALKDRVLNIRYVEAPPALRGTGAAGNFMAALMGYVRDEGLKAYPICGYAASWLKRHNEEFGPYVA